MAFAPDYGHFGGGSSYIPTLELSGNLSVDYGRNLDQLINRVVRKTPVKQARGAYLHFNPLAQARLNNHPQSNVWAPGTLRQTGFHNTQEFVQRTYQTERYDYPTTLDKRSVDLANWPVMKSHTARLGQQATTAQWLLVANKLFNVANYPSTHTATATALNGSGFTSGGTTSDPRIKNTLDAAMQVITRSTLGRVRWGTASVLINSTTALAWSKTRELREYVMQNPDAIRNIILEKGDKNYNANYNLPARLYGFNLVVDDVYYNSANEANASETGTQVVPDNQALVFLAEGDLEQEDGVASYNTCHVFTLEDYNVQAKDDEWNRLVFMNVVMDYAVEIVSPPSGFVVTNLFS
jgi:hypothetical protein